jgi:hypothetical protein
VFNVREALLEHPEIEAAGASLSIPFGTLQPAIRWSLPEREAEGADRHPADWRAATPGFLEAMGTRLIAGRDVRLEDDAAAAPVVLVDESIAELLGGARRALGRRIAIRVPGWGDPPESRSSLPEIVGVVEHVRGRDLRRPVFGQVYQPFSQAPAPLLTFALRSSLDPAPLFREVERLVQVADPELPLHEARAMCEWLDDERAPAELAIAAVLGFGLAALLLAGVGVYGLLAQLVAARRRELGVRLALGASRASLARLVLGDALLLVGCGAGIGAVFARALAPRLEGFLFGARAADPMVPLAVAALLLAGSVVAAWRPARSAARTDPLVSLRGD